MDYLEEIINRLYKLPKEQLTNENLHKVKKWTIKELWIKIIPTNIQLQRKYQELLKEWKIQEDRQIHFLLMKRKIRSLSGIVPIQVLTKPWPCPGKCIFCPNESIMPKSYISTEPGAMRALLNNFDPLKQTFNRLLSLQSTWHNTDKIEMIVLGGSFDAYDMEYKTNFIKQLYDACNIFPEIKSKIDTEVNNPKSARFTIDLEKLDIQLSSSIEEAQKINETAENRIIWLTIETRPDLVNEKNIQFWRKLGVTRIEIWIQSTFDDVLEANKRWHTMEQAKQALHLIRKYWIKISAHMMPWLYKSTIEKDIESFKILFEDPYLKPDELKFYPTSVIPNTELYQLYKKWEYTPITTEEIKKVIKEVKQNYIPPYTRIKRLIRDIPESEIVSWSTITNLRQLAENELKKELKIDKKLQEKYFHRLFENQEWLEIKVFDVKDFDNLKEIKLEKHSNENLICLCTRCREIRNQKDENENIILVMRKYLSSVGEEYFISFENTDGYLIWFTRLLLPTNDFSNFEWLGEKTAIVRELHVYGLQEKIWKKWEKSQHKGFGTKLMKTAEKLSKKNWFEKVSVISGVWVRLFYKKIWYKLEGTYMVKEI